MTDATEPWASLATDQDGAITRRQLLGCGLSPSAVDWLARDRRWQRPSPGVYLTFTGPAPWRTLAWAAVLAAGSGACLAGRSALFLHGVLDAPGPVVEVAVPSGRHPERCAGIKVTRRRGPTVAAPVGNPPRTPVEPATLDVADAVDDDADAVALVLAAVQRRRTTAVRLARALQDRSRHRRRRLLTAVLADAAEGAHSLLERRYLVDVERAHGLPRAERNLAEDEHDLRGRRRRRYRDVRYQHFRVVVELDGRTAHPASVRGEDDRRDVLLLVIDVVTLRYGWVDVVGRPCEVAAEVAEVLRARGWTGSPGPCGPGCLVGRAGPLRQP